MALAMGRSRVPLRLLVVGIAASILPDVDVIGFRLGIPYGSDYGHRGFTHSLVFSSCASHGLLDMLTTAGRGVAYFWPFSSHRYFLPLRVVEASALSITRFIHESGGHVLRSELFWVWVPCLAAALMVRWGWNRVR
jgi:inner membrane protein